MKISIVIPTCFRPEMFSNMLDSMEKTSAGYDIETIAIVDRDAETREVAKKRCTIVDYSDEMRGGIFCWNRGLELSSGDIIVPSGDDQLFYDGWLGYALESHEKHLSGCGVVGMNDLAYNGNVQLATMFVFDRRYCKDHMGGVIAPPVYNYYCVDSEINAKAKSLNMFYWDKRSIVEHLHSAHGKREKDKHDIHREENNFMEIDNKIFEERKAQGFPITWESLI
jgi:hypothetical protein